MKLSARIGMSGHFSDIDVLDSAGDIKRKHIGPRNLITNIGLERMNNAGALYSFCRVGTGNSTPSPNNLNLDNQIASASSGQATATQGVNVDEGYIWCRIVWTFALGAVVGNVSELGTGWAATGNTLFSRALILDPLGNPTSITVLEDEQLRVTWEHRRYWQPEPSSGIVENEGNKGGSYTWTCSPRQVQEWLMSVSGAQSQGNITIGGYVGPNEPYTASAPGTTYALTGVTGLGDYSGGLVGGTAVSGGMSESNPNPTTRRWRFAFNISQGNAIGGINGFYFATRLSSAYAGAGSHMRFKATIDPPILKTNEDYLELDFELSWGRYEP